VVGQVNFYFDIQGSQTQSNGRNTRYYASSTKFFNDEKRDQSMSAPNKKKNENIKDGRRVLFKIMTNGSYFGEVDIIFRRKRVYDLIAATDCDLYILSRTVNKG
jgi:hypothetical protein